MTMWLGSKTRMYVQLLSGGGNVFFSPLSVHALRSRFGGSPPPLIGCPSFLGVIFGSSTHEPTVKLIT